MRIGRAISRLFLSGLSLTLFSGSAIAAASFWSFEQRSASQRAQLQSAVMMYFENDVNEERGSHERKGEGDSVAVPFPRPLPLLGDTKA